MSAMPSFGASGPEYEIEYGGRSYRLSMLTYGLLAKLGNWMALREAEFRTTSDMALVSAGVLTVDQVMERKDKFTEEAVNKGRYAVGSERMMSVLGVLQAIGAGQLKSIPPEVLEPTLKLISLIVGCDVDTAINLMNERADEMAIKLNLLAKASYPKDGSATGATPIAA